MIQNQYTTLTGLNKYTNYSITALAFTDIGDGVRSDPIYCHTEEDGKLFDLIISLNLMISILFQSPALQRISKLY